MLGIDAGEADHEGKKIGAQNITQISEMDDSTRDSYALAFEIHGMIQSINLKNALLVFSFAW